MNEENLIVVTGAEGQLGAELCQQLGQRGIGLTRNECDLRNASQTAKAIGRLRPTTVINTAAFTAVDRAETESEECHAINAVAVAILAGVCRDLACTLVQISSDYVFGADLSRKTPYTESSAPGPLNVYGRSKLAGERHAASWHKHLIVRTCGLYGRRNKITQSNFVDTMLRLAHEGKGLRVVDDQRCTPSFVEDVARAILFLVEVNADGIYHVVNGGETSWYEFAQEIFCLAKLDAAVERISTAEYAAPAKRPAYSVLDTSKYRALGGPPLRSWKDAIASYLTGRRCDEF